MTAGMISPTRTSTTASKTPIGHSNHRNSQDQPAWSSLTRLAVAASETVDLKTAESGPTATAIANQSAFEGKAFSFDISSHFTAPAAGDTLTFSGSMPAGLMIDAHTGIISGVPTDSDFGDNTITVTATDAHGNAISETFQLQVDDGGPTATAIANQSAYRRQGLLARRLQPLHGPRCRGQL